MESPRSCGSSPSVGSRVITCQITLKQYRRKCRCGVSRWRSVFHSRGQPGNRRETLQRCQKGLTFTVRNNGRNYPVLGGSHVHKFVGQTAIAGVSHGYVLRCECIARLHFEANVFRVYTRCVTKISAGIYFGQNDKSECLVRERM